MKHSAPGTRNPDAFFAFVEGLHRLNEYLRENDGEKLSEADTFLSRAHSSDPSFNLANYYRGIALTHLRRTDAAIEVFEELREAAVPFKSEVLYNLGFAYAKKYSYDLFSKSISVLQEAEANAQNSDRVDLILLIRSMQAFVFAAFAGRHYKHPEDFQDRRTIYLPRSAELAEGVLMDTRLSNQSAHIQAAVRIEAHNAAGIAYMRMGQYGTKEDKVAEDRRRLYWDSSEKHYYAALRIHPRDVRVLDNLSTLRLIQAAYLNSEGRVKDAIEAAESGREASSQAISYNPRDRFRHYRFAQSLVALQRWSEAADVAGTILNWDGVVTEEQVARLRRAIDHQDSSVVFKEYVLEQS